VNILHDVHWVLFNKVSRFNPFLSPFKTNLYTSHIHEYMDIIRYNGKWYKINPKPYEPEKQTYEIAWGLVREPLVVPADIYKQYFERKRQEAKVLYPSFRKDVE